jgi:L-seryl-tRNA(Ser) seleniumtransferase
LNNSSRLVQLICLFCLVFSSDANADEPVLIAGRWDITIQFVHGHGNYTAFFEQTGEKLHGTYRGQFTEGTLDGTVQGKNIRFRGHLKIEGAHLIYTYNGTIEGDQISGQVDLDEYGEARWVARKRSK